MTNRKERYCDDKVHGRSDLFVRDCFTAFAMTIITSSYLRYFLSAKFRWGCVISKHFFVLFLFLILGCKTTWSQPFSQEFELKNIFQEEVCNRSMNQTMLIETVGSSDWDVTYVQLSLKIDPAITSLYGEANFHIQSKSNQLIDLHLDLSNSLKVDSIASDFGKLNFTTSNNQIHITPPHNLSLNERLEFTVCYHGMPKGSGFGSYMVDKHDDVPVAATLSEPWGASDWWPCKNSLTDKIDSLDVIVRSPEQYRTASNGKLVSDVVSNGIRTCHWKHRHPIATYLVAVGVTNYAVYNEWATLADGSNVEIVNYVYPENLETAKAATSATASMIRLYSDLFIDYPFKDEKYGHAQFPWGGGMEHQTMSFMGSLHFDIISHELAHQWFGDYITCANWHEIWLNEGFATYLNGLAWEHLDPTWWPHWKKVYAEKILSQNGGSVYVKDTTSQGRIFDSRLSYAKGAYLLHMLRGQLGDKAFFQGMKNYLNDPRISNGFATSKIFKENMEQAADTTLTAYFNDWLYGEGFPKYTIGWKQDKLNLLHLNIAQEPSLANGPLFELKLPFVLFGEGKSDTIWLTNDQANQNYLLNPGLLIDSIQFNPDRWILCTNHMFHTSKQSFTLSQLEIFPNPANQTFTINCPNTKAGMVSLYTLDGQKVFEHEYKNSFSTFYIHNLKQGIYIGQLNQNQTMIPFHLVIKH